jgi:glycosyltransferase involved in cell wall biosynthesis
VQVEAPTPDRGRALVLVRNTFRNDARVLREAQTLTRAGYAPLVVAVTSTEESMRHETQEGIPVLRLTPTLPFPRLRSRLRRSSRPGQGGADGRPAEGRPSPTRSRSRDRISRAAMVLRLYRYFMTLDFYRQAIAIVRAARPALIHCNDYNTMWVGVAARLLGRTAVIYDTHELWPDRQVRPEARWWLLVCEALFVRCAHRNITSSPGFAEVMARRYRIAPPQLIRNVPDPFPRSERRTSRRRPRWRRDRDGRSGRASAVYVGNLLRNRGLEISIRATALVPGVELRLLGPIHEPYRRELTQLVQEQGLTDRVHFLPAVPPREVVESIRGADVGLALFQPVCLSHRMLLPNKLFEYVLGGVPVLCSDLPVIGHFVRQHEVGLVARADDVEDVAAKLEEMLRPERNRDFRAAARRAAAGLTWEQEARALTDTYHDAISITARGRRR